jgi:hypothetical protein
MVNETCEELALNDDYFASFIIDNDCIKLLIVRPIRNVAMRLNWRTQVATS